MSEDREKRGRKVGSYRQTVRVLRLIEYLGARRTGASYRVLAERFEISRRQARRDVDLLEDTGFYLQRVTVDGEAGVRLIDGPDRSIRLSLRQRYTLLAIRRVFDVLEGTPFAEDVRAIFDKIVASLPEGRRDPEALADRFVYLPDGGTKQYAAFAGIVDELLSGVLYQQRVDCRYRSARGHERSGALEPYAIVLYRHGLYVVGALDDESGIRVYAIERFDYAERRRRDTFERPDDFELNDYFEGSFGVFTGGDPRAGSSGP